MNRGHITAKTPKVAPVWSHAVHQHQACPTSRTGLDTLTALVCRHMGGAGRTEGATGRDRACKRALMAVSRRLDGHQATRSAVMLVGVANSFSIAAREITRR